MMYLMFEAEWKCRGHETVERGFDLSWKILQEPSVHFEHAFSIGASGDGC